MERLCVVLLERGHDHAESLLLQVKICGHEAYVCFSPDECLRTAERVKANAVLMNAGQPMDRACQLGDRLRQLEHGVSLILRVAQPSDQVDCQRSLQSGIRLHLVKPVYPTILEHAFQMYFGQ